MKDKVAEARIRALWGTPANVDMTEEERAKWWWCQFHSKAVGALVLAGEQNQYKKGLAA